MAHGSSRPCMHMCTPPPRGNLHAACRGSCGGPQQTDGPPGRQPPCLQCTPQHPSPPLPLVPSLATKNADAPTLPPHAQTFLWQPPPGWGSSLEEQGDGFALVMAAQVAPMARRTAEWWVGGRGRGGPVGRHVCCGGKGGGGHCGAWAAPPVNVDRVVGRWAAWMEREACMFAAWGRGENCKAGEALLREEAGSIC